MLFLLTMHHLQLQVLDAVCPGQSVQVVTGSFLNDDIVTIHPLLPIDELAIDNDKFIDIEVTGLPAGKPCYSNMSLISKDSVFVSGTSLKFSKLLLKKIIDELSVPAPRL